MTGPFFEDIHGRHVPVRMIARIGIGVTKKVRGFDQVVRLVILTDGSEVEVRKDEADRLINASAPFIPAQPGTSVLYAGKVRSAPVRRVPVVAWSVDWDGTLAPWTAHGGLNDGIGSTDDPAPVLHPDGTVTGFDQLWPSLNDWLNERFADSSSQDPAAGSCGGTDGPGDSPPPETPGPKIDGPEVVNG